MSPYPDGCTQADIDNAAQSDLCSEHRLELNMDGTCDACLDQLAFWQAHSELFEPPRSDYHGD